MVSKRKQQTSLAARAGRVGAVTKLPRTRVPKSLGDRTVIKYTCYRQGTNPDVQGYADLWRPYVPGNATWPAGVNASVNVSISDSAGIGVAACYANGKFLPGTTATWVPNVGFTTSGRLWVAFTDNPEVAYRYMAAATMVDKLTIIRRNGNVVSFPVYEHHTVRVPVEMSRLKYYNSNRLTNVPVSDPTSFTDDLERSGHLFMLAMAVGVTPDLDVGTFEFHDIVQCHGLGSNGNN